MAATLPDDSGRMLKRQPNQPFSIHATESVWFVRSGSSMFSLHVPEMARRRAPGIMSCASRRDKPSSDVSVEGSETAISAQRRQVRALTVSSGSFPRAR